VTGQETGRSCEVFPVEDLTEMSEVPEEDQDVLDGPRPNLLGLHYGLHNGLQNGLQESGTQGRRAEAEGIGSFSLRELSQGTTPNMEEAEV
jgi:hypothetical protein